MIETLKQIQAEEARREEEERQRAMIAYNIMMGNLDDPGEEDEENE